MRATIERVSKTTKVDKRGKLSRKEMRSVNRMLARKMRTREIP